jgi:hypothetical protein
MLGSNNLHLMGYAFQLYAIFVVSSTELKSNYKNHFEGIFKSMGYLDKTTNYLAPALANFMNAVIAKYPDFATEYIFVI